MIQKRVSVSSQHYCDDLETISLLPTIMTDLVLQLQDAMWRNELLARQWEARSEGRNGNIE